LAEIELIKELQRAAQAAPFDPDSPFAQRKGKLSWPVAGRITTTYGARLGPELFSDYLDIDAGRGADVRAVHEGRVLFADYHSLGNMIIVEHGNGYLTVYGHLDQMFKSSGATVAVGERIATVGDTGGRPRPGLYFKLLHKERPLDSRGWFRSTAPPTR
jgi:murein hydrolase activator